jgi:hypothetical protein
MVRIKADILNEQIDKRIEVVLEKVEREHKH